MKKQRYKTLIFDLDDTLLNFKSAENQALTALFGEFSIESNQKVFHDFSIFNESLWKKLERKKITRSQLFQERFHIFFKHYFNIEVDGMSCSNRYLSYLSRGHEEISGARETLSQLYSTKKELFLATNGVSFVQERRLREAKMAEFFDQVFVSEKIGFDKPDRKFFEYVFHHSDALPEKAVIIGDSLSSDILGGSNAGIDTIWFNPRNIPNHSQIAPTHEVGTLAELLQFV